MKRIMLGLVMLLSLGALAQKTLVADYNTSAKEVFDRAQASYDASKGMTEAEIKASPVAMEKGAEFATTFKIFVANFYPKGFIVEDFVSRTSTINFKPDCAWCVGNYGACATNCWGTQCAWCQFTFQSCWSACSGGNPPLALRTK